jgi:Tol biopolymer transport system component
VDWFFRPHFAPDGVRIVQRRRGGTGTGLWLLQADRPKVLLTIPALLTRSPGSPATASVVFTMRPVAGPRDVYAVSASGGEPRAIVKGGLTTIPRCRAPRATIVFVSNREGSMDIFRATRTQESRNLTHSVDRDEYAPHWSPDGERIVVTFGPARCDLRARATTSTRRRRTSSYGSRGKHPSAPASMPDWMPPWP